MVRVGVLAKHARGRRQLWSSERLSPLQHSKQDCVSMRCRSAGGHTQGERTGACQERQRLQLAVELQVPLSAAEQEKPLVLGVSPELHRNLVPVGCSL